MTLLRPTVPVLEPLHPYSKDTLQLYIPSNPVFSAQYEVVSKSPCTFTGTYDGSIVTVSNPAGGYALHTTFSNAATQSLTVPIAPFVTANSKTYAAWTWMVRANIVSMTAIGDELTLANNSGGDGAFLHNADGTTMYSFIVGNQTNTVNAVFGSPTWYVGRYVAATSADLMTFNDAGDLLQTGSALSTVTSGNANFTGNTQTIFGTGNGTNSSEFYGYLYLSFGGYLSNDAISWFIRTSLGAM